MSYFSSLTQNVTFPAALQSVANINAGATWSSGWFTTEHVAAIQHNIKADQNTIVYVDQGSDGINADAGTDQFSHYANVGDGHTTQATSAYCQIRIKNVGLAATTALVLTTALCPIAEPLPRALSSDGNLKVGVYEIESKEIGRRALVTPMNALKVVEQVRLVGSTLADTASPNFWTTTATGTGTATVVGGQTVLATGATNASTVTQRSTRAARYMGGSTNLYRSVVRRPAVVGANVQRWGAYTALDGCFFEADNVLGFAVVTRKAGIDTRVPTGSFNGFLGVDYVIDTAAHTWEILWTNSTVYFFLDGELLHKVSASAAPWAETMSLPVAHSNDNGANINDNALSVRTATINRLGPIISQPQYLHISANGTYLFKTGAGIIHELVCGTVPTAGDWTVTVYDNVIAAAPIIGVFVFRGIAGSARVPCPIDLHDLPYSTGLTVVAAGSAGSLTVIAE